MPDASAPGNATTAALGRRAAGTSPAVETATRTTTVSAAASATAIASATATGTARESARGSTGTAEEEQQRLRRVGEVCTTIHTRGAPPAPLLLFHSRRVSLLVCVADDHSFCPASALVCRPLRGACVWSVRGGSDGRWSFFACTPRSPPPPRAFSPRGNWFQKNTLGRGDVKT